MTLAQFSPGEFKRQPEHDIRQVGEVVGEFFQRQQAGKVLRQQAEYLGVMGFAQHVHLPFGVRLGFIEHRFKLSLETAPVGGGVEDTSVEQFVEQNRVAFQIIRRPR